jgi:hypothetical protein
METSNQKVELMVKCLRCNSGNTVDWCDEAHLKRQYQCLFCGYKWEGHAEKKEAES